MFQFDAQTLSILALSAAVVSVALLVVVVVLLLRVRRLARAQRRAFDVGDGDDVVSALSRHAVELGRLREDVAVVHTNTEHLRDLLRTTVSRVAVVRYDAFEDMGGALSFSAALLDEAGTGLVVTAINGRTETRSYAKPIVDARSEHNLSREELEAIDNAINQRPPATLPPSTGRRSRRAS